MRLFNHGDGSTAQPSSTTRYVALHLIRTTSSGFRTCLRSPKVSAFEQTRPEKVITVGWIRIPDWKLLGKLSATREPKWNFWLMSVPFFPDNLVRVPAWEWRAAQGFCRFPGLDSTEAERLSGESRPPLLLGLPNGVLLKSTQRQKR